MAYNSKLEVSSTNKVHIFPSPNTKTGTNSLFPWSPRSSQSLIVKPEVFATKANYSIQPAFRTKSDLTSKVQEISIDQTWFRSTDVSNQGGELNFRDNNENRRGRTEVTTADSHRPLLVEDLIDKNSVSQKIKETRNTDYNPVIEELINDKSVKTGCLEATGKRNDTRQSNNNALEAKVKATDLLPNSNAYVHTETDMLDERLDKVEQLILSEKQVLAKFGQSGGKFEHETEYKPFQESNSVHVATQGQGQGLIKNELDNVERNREYIRSDSYSASICSSCSVASTYPSRSRCSSGDGCSSVECDGRHINVCSLYSHGQYQHGSFVRGGDMNSSCSKQSLEQLLFKTPHLARKNPDCELRETEPNTLPQSLNHNCNCHEDQLSKTIRHTDGRHFRTPHVGGKDDLVVEEAHSCGGHISRKANSISQVQLMFYILKLQICKYGELKSVIEAQQLTLNCQSQSINRLVQYVMLLSVKLHQQTSSLDCLTAALRRQEAERQSTKRRQTVLIITVLGLVCIYVLQLETVQGKIAAFFRMFGITRQLKSLNSLPGLSPGRAIVLPPALAFASVLAKWKRRMISEIWRDIPPLLTNFWRIFIFRGGT